LLDLGYLFESFPQQTKALDDGAAKPLEQALRAGANVQIIGWAYNFGSRSVLCKSPVNAPPDLAGKRIRTLSNKIITECLRLMGAAATPLAFGEIYTALQAGVLDGLEHDPPTIVASKFYETAIFAHPAQFFRARRVLQWVDADAHGGAAARPIPEHCREGGARHESARAGSGKGGDGGAEAEGRRNHHLRP
jgi:hypothetical protein